MLSGRGRQALPSVWRRQLFRRRECTSTGELFGLGRYPTSLVGVTLSPCHTIVCADHGDCWGEDGLWEHGISHPCTLTVPLLLRVRGQSVD